MMCEQTVSALVGLLYVAFCAYVVLAVATTVYLSRQSKQHEHDLRKLITTHRAELMASETSWRALVGRLSAQQVPAVYTVEALEDEAIRVYGPEATVRVTQFRGTWMLLIEANDQAGDLELGLRSRSKHELIRAGVDALRACPDAIEPTGEVEVTF